MTGQQKGDGTGTHPREHRVGAAGEYDRYARTQHDAGHVRTAHVFELLRQHVAGFDIRYQQNVGVTGKRRQNTFDEGCLWRYRIVKGQGAIGQRASDLASLGHLAQCGRVGDEQRTWIGGRIDGTLSCRVSVALSPALISENGWLISMVIRRSLQDMPGQLRSPAKS